MSGEKVTEVRKSLFRREMIYIIREIHVSSYIYRHVTKLKVSVSINMDRTGCLAVGGYFGDRRDQRSITHSV